MIKKKIGIITINDYGNFGNRLQNYALKKAIEKLNLDVDSVRITSIEQLDFKGKLIKLGPIGVFRVLINRLKQIKSKLVFRKRHALRHIKHSKFKCFSEMFLSEKFVNLKNSFDVEKLEEYDFFVTGSDQVWNPGHPENMLDIYFLTFTERNKRIAYAPSIALSEIPLELKNKYKNWLSNMGIISIREESGAKIINELININPPVLVDPTLLLSKEEWLEIASKEDGITNKKYILLYYLGDAPDEVQKMAKEVSERFGYDIVQVFNENYEETYKNGPSEFVRLFSSAEIVFTDSFHGTVFSIIFETPFVVSKRLGKGIYSKMYTRIEGLLDMFEFRMREFENIKTSKNLFNQDFKHVEAILGEERSKVYSFLKNALQIKGDK